MPIFSTIVAGLVGTAFMTTLMTVIHRKEWANADMVRALGSLVTRNPEKSAGIGVLIHVLAGIGFAVPYTMMLTKMQVGHGMAAAMLGAGFGFIHGIVVSFMLVAVISERHPVEKFRNAGVEVALAHIAGHVGYGFGVGVMYALLNIVWTDFL